MYECFLGTFGWLMFPSLGSESGGYLKIGSRHKQSFSSNHQSELADIPKHKILGFVSTRWASTSDK